MADFLASVNGCTSEGVAIDWVPELTDMVLRGLAFEFVAGGHQIELRPDVQAAGCWRVLLDGSDFASRLVPADAVQCAQGLIEAARAGWTGP